MLVYKNLALFISNRKTIYKSIGEDRLCNKQIYKYEFWSNGQKNINYLDSVNIYHLQKNIFNNSINTNKFINDGLFSEL